MLAPVKGVAMAKFENARAPHLPSRSLSINCSTGFIPPPSHWHGIFGQMNIYICMYSFVRFPCVFNGFVHLGGGHFCPSLPQRVSTVYFEEAAFKLIVFFDSIFIHSFQFERCEEEKDMTGKSHPFLSLHSIQ